MVKLLVAGLWVCVVTLGAVYFSVKMATAPAVDPEIARQAGLELVKGEAITIPLIADGKVGGYFLGRISFMMNKEKSKGAELPMTELMTDELFTLLIGNKMIDIAHMADFDVAKFREAIKTDMNKHLGDGFVEEVLIEQLDFLSKDDTRTTGEAPSKSQSKPVKIVEGETVAEPSKASH